MTADCGHPLCELIGGSCSIATGRSRGCTPSFAPASVAPAIFDEVRALLVVLEAGVHDERSRAAAVSLAEIIRREAREDRHLLAHARMDDGWCTKKEPARAGSFVI